MSHHKRKLGLQNKNPRHVWGNDSYAIVLLTSYKIQNIRATKIIVTSLNLCHLTLCGNKAVLGCPSKSSPCIITTMVKRREPDFCHTVTVPVAVTHSHSHADQQYVPSQYSLAQYRLTQFRLKTTATCVGYPPKQCNNEMYVPFYHLIFAFL